MASPRERRPYKKSTFSCVARKQGNSKRVLMEEQLLFFNSENLEKRENPFSVTTGM